MIVYAGPVDHRPKGETENFTVLPSSSYFRTFRSAKNIVTHNRKIYVDRSDKRRHENGIDMSACMHLEANVLNYCVRGRALVTLYYNVICRLPNATCARKLVGK